MVSKKCDRHTDGLSDQGGRLLELQYATKNIFPDDKTQKSDQSLEAPNFTYYKACKVSLVSPGDLYSIFYLF